MGLEAGTEKIKKTEIPDKLMEHTPKSKVNET